MYKFLQFPYFLFFITILSYALILPISQLETQQLMTSQIRSYIEYLIRTYIIIVLILIKICEKSSLVDDFWYDLMMIVDSDLLFWATL